MKMDREILVGRQILDVITSGMYNNPLMVYREYIQNSVDAIDQLNNFDKHKIDDAKILINIDGRNRNVVIEDNGVGIPEAAAKNILFSLGLSSKEKGGYRGFRGIGRLGGLAYCDRLIFETRAFGEGSVSKIVWSRLELDELAKTEEQISLEDALLAIVSSSVKGAKSEDPLHFFRVTMENVHFFHSDHIMNVGVVNNYLSQVSPVPFSNEFSSGKDIDGFLQSIDGYKTYEISVNGKIIYKPYVDKVEFGENNLDHVDNIQEFEIFGDDNNIIAKGWFAKLKYLGSLPAQNKMRGIRVRQGNIEIGGEYFLADCFTERRFATWQIGEIQVDINSLRANARRDGFEETQNYEKLLEFLSRLGGHLSKSCRDASKKRNNLSKAAGSIERMKECLDIKTIYIDKDHYAAALSSYKTELKATRKLIENNNFPDNFIADIEKIEDELEARGTVGNYLVDMINAQKFSNKSGKKAFIDFVRSFARNKGNNAEADRILMECLSEYLKQNVKGGTNVEFVISNIGA